MQTKKKKTVHTTMVSDSFEKSDEKCNYEVSFRRWLVNEIEEHRLTMPQAIAQFNFDSRSAYQLIGKWRRQYAPEMILALPSMTEKEKQELALLQQRLELVEKDLEDARMRNIALNMLIDVAEDKLKISIRKKPGAKQ